MKGVCVIVFQYIVGINKQAKIPTTGEKKKSNPKNCRDYLREVNFVMLMFFLVVDI